MWLLNKPEEALSGSTKASTSSVPRKIHWFKPKSMLCELKYYIRMTVKGMTLCYKQNNISKVERSIFDILD